MRSSSEELRVFGLFLKPKNVSLGIAVENPKARSRLAIDRGSTQRDVSAALEMRLQQVSVIHAVKLIAAQDQIMFIRPLQKVVEVLAHRIRRALVPAGPLGRLLSGQNLDKAFSKAVEFVAVQGLAVKLRQNVDLAKTAVEAIADRDVH